mgnify:CR=1 FL=1
MVANDEDITPGAHDALIATLLLCAQLLVPKNPTPDESELVCKPINEPVKEPVLICVEDETVPVGNWVELEMIPVGNWAELDTTPVGRITEPVTLIPDDPDINTATLL